ncbi:MAG: DNA-3-methyladenine glycosylase I [Spirochaetes bacterium]|nr:DNA-3-methyladenine glycosylase I [Spirochaetota bacterium]
MKRCQWAGSDPLYIAYHDKEWGVPVYDDQKFFEFILLEGAQAGLSWITILRKRENYRLLFDQFDPQIIAQYDDIKIQSLLTDSRIIRNRLKINSAISNAQNFLKIQQKHGSFSNYIWQFTDGKPVINQWKSLKDIPVSTELSDRISKDLKQQGFKFVGTVIIYSFLQAVGIVNDHIIDCFRYQEINRLSVC